MPRVTIKTGLVAPDGQEVFFSEYLCDCPGCVNVAERVVGVAPELMCAFAVCQEHAAMLPQRTDKPDPD